MTGIMRSEVFGLLDTRLRALSDIAEHASIHFANAASAESREGRGLEACSLQQSKEALQCRTETAELVGRCFLSRGVGDILPVPQYDQFAFMDQPLVTADFLFLAICLPEGLRDDFTVTMACHRPAVAVTLAPVRMEDGASSARLLDTSVTAIEHSGQLGGAQTPCG